MPKKHLVFISSTQEDLKAERREVIRVVSELGAFPVVMDAFDIGQEEDRKIIYRAIEECDYFLNLTAYRGGKTYGKSFAPELEYSFAVKAGLPVLSLLISEKARWKAAKKETEPAAAKALEAFKKKLEAHPHERWANLGDLKAKALGLLTREMGLNPRRGWVPASEAVAPSVANVLSALIQENESLRYKLLMGEARPAKKLREQIKDTFKMLAANRISLSFYYVDGENWENTKSFRYLRLFALLAPELPTPKTTADISHFLGNILNPNLEKLVRKDYPTPSNTIKKIMADLTVLKLVKCTKAALPAGEGAGDSGFLLESPREAWEMSEFGKEIFTLYRLKKMNREEKNRKDNSTNS